MSQPVDLSLRSASGGKLVHKYYPGDGEAAPLLVTLPGDHYGVDGPLLYYPSLVLRGAGWSTFAITYGYQAAGEPFTLTALPDMVEEVSAALKEALRRGSQVRVGLVGKSLGAALLATLASTLPELESARMVYLTPPLGVPLFAPAFLETRQKSLIVIGTADRFYDQDTLESMRTERSFELLEIDGADHSLTVESGLAGTLSVHERAVDAVVAFLRE